MAHHRRPHRRHRDHFPTGQRVSVIFIAAFALLLVCILVAIAADAYGRMLGVQG